MFERSMIKNEGLINGSILNERVKKKIKK